MHPDEDRLISPGCRVAFLVVGLASWAAGGVAAFLSDNSAGTAALIVTGALTSALSLVGRWPSRVAVSGNEISWESIDQTMNSQIRVAQQDDDGEAALRELLSLRDRLALLQQTGTVPIHPGEAYDLAVMAAISRLLPGAEIITPDTRSRAAADITVRYRGSDLLVETKWRIDPGEPFGGSTLPILLSALPAGARLLVVTNTSVPPLPHAYHIVRDALGDRGRIVCWLDVRDDRLLGQALMALFLAEARNDEDSSLNGLGLPDIQPRQSPPDQHPLDFRRARP